MVRLWSYSGIKGWHDALNLGVTGPDKLWGMTQGMGKGGEFLVFQTYFGPNHVFREDGLYVGALLKDGRLMLNRGQDEGQPEGQGGYFGKLRVEADRPERYFLIGGGQDARVWEVVGLDTIRDLPGGTYAHTPELAEQAERAQREYRLALAAANQIAIGRDLATAKPVEKEREAGRAFRVKLARDDRNLRLEYEVRSDTPLVNAWLIPSCCSKAATAWTCNWRTAAASRCVCWSLAIMASPSRRSISPRCRVSRASRSCSIQQQLFGQRDRRHPQREPPGAQRVGRGDGGMTFASRPGGG